MNKPELLITAGSLNEIQRFIDAGADAVTIGDAKYGLRVPRPFTIHEMEEAVRYVHAKGKKIYIAVNALLHNETLKGLGDYITRLASMGADGVEYADPAVLMTAKQYTPELALHWNAEIIATSSATVNYWGSKGVKRAILSRELNMDEITEIKRETDIEIGVQVHGITCIFHSNRKLVSSYFSHQGKKGDTGMERGLSLKEEKREENYPIFEDAHGTHIMSSEDICILEYLDQLLESGIDSLRIEGLLKPSDYNETVVGVYRKAINLYYENSERYSKQQVREWLNDIKRKQDPKRPLTTGFFFKELVY